LSGGGKISFNGYAKEYRVGATLDNVLLTDLAAYKYAIHQPILSLGRGR
jgi:polygalacturonase